MQNRPPLMKLSRDEENFLRHWMYDEAHYREGSGPAKRLQREHRAVPADLAVLIAAAISDTSEQWAAGEGPPPADPPTWPWSDAALRARVAEANDILAAARDMRIRMRKAMHEAGHAALAFEMGIGVQYVNLSEENGRLGFCEYAAGLNQRLEYEFAQWGERYAMVMLGGMEAEKRLLRDNGMPEEPMHPIAWSEDIRLVKKAIACMFRLIHSTSRRSRRTPPGSCGVLAASGGTRERTRAAQRATRRRRNATREANDGHASHPDGGMPSGLHAMQLPPPLPNSRPC